MYPFLCLQCVGEYLKQKNEESNGEGFTLSAEELNEHCNVAITMAPTWNQIQPQPGQMMLGCVAVPVCPIHLTNQTAQQTGRSGSGLLVPGGLN
jgi:hypothetical protein